MPASRSWILPRAILIGLQAPVGPIRNLIGSWLENHPGRQDKLLIATKSPFSRELASGNRSKARWLASTPITIDLFQSHHDDKDAAAGRDAFAYGELINKGKIRCISASNYEAPRLAGSRHRRQRHGPATVPEPTAALQPA